MKDKIPVGMSAGGDNAYYFDCPVLEQRRAYAVCVHLGARYDEGNFKKEGDVYADCFSAIERGNCPALYYKPRPDIQIDVVKIDKSSPSYARGWNGVPGKRVDDLPDPRRRSQSEQPKAADQGEKDGFAAAITQAAKEERASAQSKGSPLDDVKMVETKAERHRYENKTPMPTLAELAKQMRGKS